VTSNDGRQWSSKGLALEASLRAVAFGGGRWVAVGERGVFVSSTNLVTWDRGLAPFGGNLNAVCYGNGSFVAVGEHGVVLNSPTGRDWQPRQAPLTNGLTGICFQRADGLP